MSPGVREIAKTAPAVAIAKQQPLRILAIDYGRRRIGLAVSDALALTAQPLATVERTNRRDDLRRLREICAEHHVGRILVGHPLRLNGEAGEMAHEAARFAARLKKHLGIEVELVDERLTSWEAAQTVAETETRTAKTNSRSQSRHSSHRRSRRSARPSLDHIAAAILLRDYLSHKRTKQAASAGESAPGSNHGSSEGA